MNPLPSQLVEGLSETEADEANTWWCLLAEEEQAELSTLYHSRQDSCRVISKRITILVDSDVLFDDDGETDDLADYLEYVLNHPELYPVEEPFFRTFYIGCSNTQHAVHSVVQRASASFACPFSSPVCPFRRSRRA